MISLPTPALAVLAQAAAARDTVFVVQAKPGWQTWIEALAAVATIVVALALLAVGVGVLVAAARVKKLTRKVEEQAQKLRLDLAPALRNVNTVSDNLTAISRNVRDDVGRLSETVQAANGRLRRAAEVAEERLGEFNAVIGVVQEEAENLLIGSASAARGLKAGAEAFRRLQARDDARDDDAARDDGDDGDDDEDWDDEDDLYDEDGYDDQPYDDDGDLADEIVDTVEERYGARRDPRGYLRPRGPRAAPGARARGGAGEIADEDLTDDDVTDEELEIRVARRDAQRIDPDQVF